MSDDAKKTIKVVLGAGLLYKTIQSIIALLLSIGLIEMSGIDFVLYSIIIAVSFTIALHGLIKEKKHVIIGAFAVLISIIPAYLFSNNQMRSLPFTDILILFGCLYIYLQKPTKKI